MAKTANNIKKVADNTVGLINRAERFLIENIDPANKNLFQFILYPKILDDKTLATGFINDLASNLGTLALDTLIAQIYLRSVDLSFLEVEYEQLNEIKVPKKLNFPDSIVLNILEDEFGTVGNYLYKWMNSIVFPVNENDFQSSVTRVNYYWVDNQEATKKNATLIPQSGIGLPSLRYIRIYGLKYKGIENITYDHKDGDPLIYTVNCSVDSVWFKPLF